MAPASSRVRFALLVYKVAIRHPDQPKIASSSRSVAPFSVARVAAAHCHPAPRFHVAVPGCRATLSFIFLFLGASGVIIGLSRGTMTGDDMLLSVYCLPGDQSAAPPRSYSKKSPGAFEACHDRCRAFQYLAG
jgi:hypothetical protein